MSSFNTVLSFTDIITFNPQLHPFQIGTVIILILEMSKLKKGDECQVSGLVSNKGSFTLSWVGAKAYALTHSALLLFFCFFVSFFFSSKAFTPLYLCLYLVLTKFLSFISFSLPKSFALILSMSCDIFFLDLTNFFLSKHLSGKHKLASFVYNKTETLGHSISLTLPLFTIVKFLLNSFFRSL